MTMDCAVVGAGPAGLAAAIQMTRMGWETEVFERDAPGGLLREAFLVENYPGFPGGLPGSRLASLMAEQAAVIGVRVRYGEVLTLSRSRECFSLRSEDGETEARTVILATGTRPCSVDIPGLQDLQGGVAVRGVSSLPEGLGGMDVIIIGGGDAAFDYALTILRRGGTPIIVHRSEPSALGLLVQRTREKCVRTLQAHVKSLEMCGEGLRAVTEAGDITAHHVLLACGREPETGLMDGAAPPGVFLAGDVANGWKRQTTMAVGGGMSAAMDADRMLSHQEDAR